MNYFKILLSLCFTMILAVSCEEVQEESEIKDVKLYGPVYQFDEEQKDLIVKNVYDVGDCISFVNDDELELQACVQGVNKGISQRGGTTGWYSIPRFQTEYSTIHFTIDDPRTSFETTLAYVADFSRFGNFNVKLLFSYYNNNATQFTDGVVLNGFFDQPEQVMTIGERTFYRVVEINSGTTLEYVDSHTNITVNVNKIWYDIDYGIIGFSTVQNEDWLIKP
ncbi:hypothetical protein JCM19294_867 [Nonlabens tegetincola]|uniref:Uncharacterized protein n=1 Tax=Nonlabens tegetincola TaxID=323273 RepID=A0A090Q8Y0_9FLAO|nr:hypothetical protein [Nonlabens tegetincola]GAK98233.1 hypothetical protein JCM19294_867 [Nonlabens tegetincola]